MGGRKLRLSVRRKQHKKVLHSRIVTGLKISIPVEFTVKLPPLCVSLPISSYRDAPCADVNTVRSRIKSCSPLPPTWVVNDTDSPLILCKLKTFQLLPPKINVSVTLSINDQLQWSVSFLQTKLDPTNCCILNGLAATVSSVSSLVTILSHIDSSKVCVGNPDTDILEMWHQRSLSLHGSNGIICHIMSCINSVFNLSTGKNTSGFLDEASSSDATIRHVHCQFLLRDGDGDRCLPCVKHRATLLVQLQRARQATASHTAPTSHVNYRYMYNNPDSVRTSL